jgi:hypothetical protein
VKRKLTWLAGWLCAALALGLVFWLRSDGDKKGGVAGEGNAPRVTKPYPRERDARETRTKNPREEFEAARKRGMTEEEVRGIVEEFMRTGIGKIDLSNALEKELLDHRKAENSWYLKTLVQGFGLTPDQEREAAQELHKSRVLAYSIFLGTMIQAAATIDIEAVPNDEIIDPDPFSDEVANWISVLGYRPWDLCELDVGQKEIIGLKNDGEEWIWPRPGSETWDFGTEEKYVDLDDPFSEHKISVAHAGYVFPLSMDQVDHIHAANKPRDHTLTDEDGNLLLLNEIKVLTPLQLRTLLLVQPSFAKNLMKELGE